MSKLVKLLFVGLLIFVFIGCSNLDGIIPGVNVGSDDKNESSTGLKDVDFSSYKPAPKGDLSLSGKFFSVGYPVANNSEGLIQISEDGYTWEKYHKCKDGELFDIEYAYGKLVAVGSGGVTYTNDGETWESVSDAVNFTTSADYDHTLSGLEGIAYGDDMFVAVGGGSRLVFSNDGETWIHSTIESIDPDLTYAQTHLKNVQYINGKFYVTGNMNRVVVLTKDAKKGLVMESNTSLGKVTSITTDIAYGNDMFFLVGTTNDYYSKDGKNWNELDGWTQVYGVIFKDGKFYGASGFGEIVYTEDGTKWDTLLKQRSTTYFDIVYGNGVFVTAGRMGALAVSKDGENWETVDTGESNTVNGLIYID